MSAVDAIALLAAAAIPLDDWLAKYSTKQSVPKSVIEADFRPQLMMPGGESDPREFATQLGVILGKNGLYLRAGAVWFHDTKQKQLMPMRSGKFVHWVMDHVRLMGTDMRSGREVFAKMSGEMASHLLDAPQFQMGLPALARVAEVRMPYVDEAGKVGLLPVGYHEGMQTLTLGSCDYPCDMPLFDALEVLRSKWTGEFPLELEKHETTCPYCTKPECRCGALSMVLSAMFAPFLELMMPMGVRRPVFVMRANKEGSGKTLLVQLCLCPLFGPLKITAPPEKKGEEIKKLLGAVAMAAEPYLFIDNWKGEDRVGGAGGFRDDGAGERSAAGDE